MQRFNLTRQFFRDVWYLTKSYWQSEEKKKAFFLLGCIIALTLGVVYMLVLLNQWNNSFYSALQNYDAKKIFDELIHFSWLAAIYILLAVYSYYLQQTLILNWRRWLTTRFIDIWLQNKTYYNLQMFGKDTDNPDQRISEDVRQFVEMTLSFGIGILKAFCTFASFVVILYNLSGSLSFTFMGKTWTINGYMLWASLLYSVIGTYITHIVGRKLVKINFIQQKYEADFRFSMIRLRESAESVAFYRGEAQEGSVFKQRFKMLLDNFWKLVNKQKQLVFLNSGYSQIAIIFPFVVAMNRYLTKEVTLGGLMQVASAFGRVQDSLSYFVDMYSSIAQWQAVVMRLTYFGHHMHEVSQQAERFHVERFAAADVVEVNDMQINLPDGKPLLEKLIGFVCVALCIYRCRTCSLCDRSTDVCKCYLFSGSSLFDGFSYAVCISHIHKRMAYHPAVFIRVHIHLCFLNICRSLIAVIQIQSDTRFSHDIRCIKYELYLSRYIIIRCPLII